MKTYENIRPRVVVLGSARKLTKASVAGHRVETNMISLYS